MWLMLVLAILSSVVAVIWALLIAFGNMMADTDAPGTAFGYWSVLIPLGVSAILFAAWWWP